MTRSRRSTPSHRLNTYRKVIVRVSYGYGYTRGSGRVWVEIFGAGWVRVASSATGTGRVAEMVDPHTPSDFDHIIYITRTKEDLSREETDAEKWNLGQMRHAHVCRRTEPAESTEPLTGTFTHRKLKVYI